MTRVVAIASQKGGVGKTTTAINVAAVLAQTKRKVLAIDLDSQANLTCGVGLDPQQQSRGIYAVLLGLATLDEVIQPSGAGFDVVCANQNLTGAQVELLNVTKREYLLNNALSALRNTYNWVLLDCPPSLNIVTINALVAADGVIVPTQTEFFAMQGLVDLLRTIGEIRRNFNPNLKLNGILRTMHDTRNKLNREVASQLKEFMGEDVYRTIVPRNVRLAEATSHGKSVLAYDKMCAGSLAYTAFTGELLSQEPLT